jgi:tRNA threonylcarbamoyl adenosine modification protein (Sua5/YciO/YrdC/YwlC family)
MSLFKDTLMATVWRVHSIDPQQRSIQQASKILASGGLIICPTECSYVLLHRLNEKKAHEKVLKIRDLPKEHQFTLLCSDLSEIAQYAQVGSAEHRILRKHCPGPYTFVLPATRLLPKRLIGPRRKTIGVRISDHPVCKALLAELAEPVVTTTARVGAEETALSDPEELERVLGRQVDGILLVEEAVPAETTIVDLVSEPPQVIRAGKGPLDQLGI